MASSGRPVASRRGVPREPSGAEHRFAEIARPSLFHTLGAKRLLAMAWLCEGSSCKPWRDSKPVQVPETRQCGKRILTSAGQGGCCGVVDEIVFGVDLDGSSQRVRDVRSSRAYADARGLTTLEMERKANCASMVSRPAGAPGSTFSSERCFPNGFQRFWSISVVPGSFSKKRQ